MNYYEHHLGDYAEATAHLSFIEDASYSRLIRKYYASERPIPADIAAAQRLVGARSKEERAAVETVLREFFVLRDDGWHQDRCDAEIARYQDKQDKAKRSANARWNKAEPHTEGNANAMRTHSEGNALQTPDTRHQTPDTRHQTPEREEAAQREVAVRSPKGSRLTLQALPDDFREFCQQARPDLSPSATWDGFRDYWIAKAGRDAVRADWLATWRTWVRRQHAPQQARASPASKHANVIAELTGRAPRQPQQEFIDVRPRTIAERLG